jgi:hypothetical protein
MAGNTEQGITQRELDKLLAHLTKTIDEYHALRAANDKVAFGLAKGKVESAKAKEIIEKARAEYKPKEQNAVEELRALFKLMSTGQLPANGRELLQEGTAAIPLIVWPAVAGGAILVSQAFNYLSERERRIQVELGGSTGLFGGLFGGNLLTYAALGIGGWFLWTWWSDREKEKAAEDVWAEMRRNGYPPALPPHYDEDEDDE